MKTSWHNFSDAIFHHAELHPERSALVDGGRNFNYRDLARLVGQASVYLQGLGIKQGVPVGIAMNNSAEHIILTLAVFRIGGVLIELPSEITDIDLAARVARFQIIASFVDVGGPSSSAAVAVRIGPAWLEEIAKFKGDTRAQANADDLRLIVVSSGSTGIPKGIVTTQRQRMVRAATWRNLFAQSWTEADPGVVILPAPPSMSLYGQFLIIQYLLGGTLVVLPKFTQGIDLVRAIAPWHDAICPIVPGMARGFLNCATGTGLLFPHMRAMVSSGLPLAGHEKLGLVKQVTPNMHDVYGSGGFGAFSHLGPDDILDHPSSVGRAVKAPGNEIELVGPDNKPVAPGVEGRLRCRGVNVSLGFFNPEDNSRGSERFTDGWYYPGDILQQDDAGYFYMRGRADDAFVAGELTVYPPEIEDIITRHPDISEAVVVGRPTGDNGIELVGFIVCQNGLTHEAVVAHCMAHLPPAKRPRSLFYIDAIPRTGNGKIDRPALKETASLRAKQLAG